MIARAAPKARRVKPTASHPQKSVRIFSTAVDNTSDLALVLPWKTPMIESHGDYREEASLETHVGGPLYEHQATLPRLPIPSIEETLERFLPTALPMAKSEEECATLLEACELFPSQAKELQKRLEQRREEFPDSSWLQLWWNTAGYLQVRDPVMINVSYFFHFSDDPTLPFNQPKNVKRGAAILTAVAEYRKKVCSGAMPAETLGKKKTPLCSVAFKYMFHACRIPRRNQDSYRIYDPSRHLHCIVARKGHFFSLDFIDVNGNALPLEKLEEGLQQCIAMADQCENSGRVELGWLTSNDRDSWADARNEMIRTGGVAVEDALTKLESGAMLLCLDDEEPVSRKQCAELFLHGNLTSGNNRFFDKSIQIFVTNNGKAGLMGEHSMMDGMPMVGLADHMTATTYAAATQRSSHVSVEEANTQVKNIFDEVNLSLQTSKLSLMIAQAKHNYTKLVTDHDIQVQSFQGYGSNFIKKAGFSPDAYVQMAMQLATYRLFGEQAGTYEATQVRPFLHGRTETTRSVSPASEAFVKAMGLSPKYDEHDTAIRTAKLGLLRDAVETHVNYIGDAAKAHGVDRHFLGLSMLVGDGEEAPTLYSHPLFIRSKRWRVSTSHLTHKKFENWGYGEVVPDGVGLAYAIKADNCVFNIVALRKHQWTEPLSHYLEEALNEMQQMIEIDQAMSSKL
jgi:carnitine O-acetyltransferase